MLHALRKAVARRYSAVVLVGDAGYYRRFGFSSENTGALYMPGPFERERLLGCELIPGALKGAHGLIAAGRPPRSRFSKIMESLDRPEPAVPRMA
jgi:predicted N-acetyltransferase YhbS